MKKPQTIAETLPQMNPESSAVNVVDTSSLRQFLIKGMKDVVKGEMTTWQAKAACNFAQQIYNVTALEVKVTLAQEKLRGKQIQPVSFISNVGEEANPTV